MMNLTERQHKVLDFARIKHEGQQRKYTGEPYINHCLSVAQIASKYIGGEGIIEVAICHDLLEDTDCEMNDLFEFLLDNGYTSAEAGGITHGVYSLTDSYTKESHPEFNRKERKRRERERLSQIDPIFQSIKYADLIDNTSSIVKHDKNFAKVYLQEKKAILDKMRDGNIDLFIECCYTLQTALNQLEK